MSPQCCAVVVGYGGIFIRLGDDDYAAVTTWETIVSARRVTASNQRAPVTLSVPC